MIFCKSNHIAENIGAFTAVAVWLMIQFMIKTVGQIQLGRGEIGCFFGDTVIFEQQRPRFIFIFYIPFGQVWVESPLSMHRRYLIYPEKP